MLARREISLSRSDWDWKLFLNATLFCARNISVICAIVDLCARYTLYFGPAQATREVLLSRLHPILSPSYIVIKRDYSLPPAAVLLNWR